MRMDLNTAESEEPPMPSTKSYQHLHDGVTARPGSAERLADLREETLAEVGLFDLRRALGLSQIAMAEDIGISQSAVSQLERSGDLKLSTLRRYLSHLGAQLHLVAVFDDESEEHGIEFRIGDEQGS